MRPLPWGSSLLGPLSQVPLKSVIALSPAGKGATLLVLSLHLGSSLMGGGGESPFAGEVGDTSPYEIAWVCRRLCHREGHREPPKRGARRPLNLPIDFNGELTLPCLTLNNS